MVVIHPSMELEMTRRHEIKLSAHQKDALSEYLGALRSNRLPKGILWQTRRSLVRLGLLDYAGTLTELGWDLAHSIRDEDVLDVWVRRPRR